MGVLTMCVFSGLNGCGRHELFFHNQLSIEKYNGLFSRIVYKMESSYYKCFAFTSMNNICFFEQKDDDYNLCILNPNDDSIRSYHISSERIVNQSATINSIAPICLYVDENSKTLMFINRNSKELFNQCSIIVINYENNKLIYERENDSDYSRAICGYDYSNSIIYYTKRFDNSNLALYYSKLFDDNNEYLVADEISVACISADCKKIAYFKNDKLYVYDLNKKKEYELSSSTIIKSVTMNLSFSSNSKYLIYSYEIPRLSLIVPENKNLVYRWDYESGFIKKVYTNNNGTSKAYLYYIDSLKP